MRMRMLTILARTGAAALLVGLTGGCGGGHGVSDTLHTLQAGDTWTYSVAGSVTLPASLGGTTQNLQTKSTLTETVAAETVKDLNGEDTHILDRKLDLFLLDGREIQANFRLYFTQTSLGVFVHGINDYVGTVANSSNDVFVPATTTPPFKFLYLPNPLADGQTVSYTNPLGLTVSGNPAPDVSYTLQAGAGRQPITAPAGTFVGKPVNIVENFNQSFSISAAGAGNPPVAQPNFVSNVGFISGVLNATLPDGTKVQGVITLTKYQF